ncbi:uncharacterized protein SPSK_06749 [Sporothrix schenckii 1099-18]|uniref:Uncharacterized protein n=1 Tax=Sporothrix schenckii 1099-18 TaxID=1397361 RepID=A0A0F2MJP8_SPOSC|nr:uncharacterized protein SPSK_06749 [Sporothrix schenckii 1099-18]KJR89847.1 hypothetical protein SPSK_06749 [Sporothrix schenckii 1099-18]
MEEADRLWQGAFSKGAGQNKADNLDGNTQARKVLFAFADETCLEHMVEEKYPSKFDKKNQGTLNAHVSFPLSFHHYQTLSFLLSPSRGAFVGARVVWAYEAYEAYVYHVAEFIRFRRDVV